LNPPARRVYEAVGFVTEGALREEHRWGDRWLDDILMSILDHEWRRDRDRPALPSCQGQFNGI
jgi:RimJ/RimL family protein N-acetyltransferase